MESTGTALQHRRAYFKLKMIENLRSAICNSERSEDGVVADRDGPIDRARKGSALVAHGY